MKSFEAWWKEIISEEIWYEQVQMQHKGKLLPAAKHIYIEYCADVEAFKSKPLKEQRMHIHNKAAKMSWKDVPVIGVELQQINEVLPEVTGEAVVPPLVGDARKAKIKEWLESVQAVETQTAVPKLTHKQIVEEGDWLPAKTAVYVPAVDADLFRLKELITRFASRKYNGYYDFRHFKTFTFGLVEVVAESQEDAEMILERAKRFVRRKK